MFKRIIAATAGLAAIVTGAAGVTALAATETHSDDRHDAAPRFDIVRAVFNNGDQRLSGKAKVANLRYGGEQYFSFTFSPRNSPDVYFTAFSKLHADDSLTNRLIVHNDIGEVSRIPCNVTSIWSPGADTVRVSIPRDCVDGLSGSQYMSVNLGPTARRGTQDRVIAASVRQG